MSSDQFKQKHLLLLFIPYVFFSHARDMQTIEFVGGTNPVDVINSMVVPGWYISIP